MANKKKSIELKLLEGTHRTDRDGDPGVDDFDSGSVARNGQNNSGNSELDDIQPLKKPVFVKKKAAKHWRRLLPLMEHHNLIAEIDSDQLGRYCILLARFIEAEEHLAEDGAVIMMEINRVRQTGGRPTKESLDGDVEKVFRKPTRNPWVDIAKDCSSELRQYEKSMRMTNDSNPDLHGKRKVSKGKNGKLGADRFFN